MDNNNKQIDIIEQALIEKSPSWMVGIVGIFRVLVKDSVYAILAVSGLLITLSQNHSKEQDAKIQAETQSNTAIVESINKLNGQIDQNNKQVDALRKNVIKLKDGKYAAVNEQSNNSINSRR